MRIMTNLTLAFMISLLLCYCNSECILTAFKKKYSDKRHSYYSNTSLAAGMKFDCSRHCEDDHLCNSFQYNRITKQCMTHPVCFESSLWEYAVDEEVGNDIFYRMNGNGLGSTCKSSLDCEVMQSSCENGVCKCEPGLSYNQLTNTCNEQCDTYGREVTMYSDMGILGHNTRTITSISLADCTTACVEETKFLCRTIDYDPAMQTCMLQAAGFLDVLPHEQLWVDPGWLLGIRDCAQ